MEELLATLFAGDESKPIMSILDGATETQYTGSSKTVFGYVPTGYQGVINSQGRYENFIFVEVKDHTLTFGCRKESKLTGDWTILDHFRLTYYGDDPDTYDAVRDISGQSEAAKAPVAYYTLSGTPLAKPSKGINIVKYSDGSTRKIMVK